MNIENTPKEKTLAKNSPASSAIGFLHLRNISTCFDRNMKTYKITSCNTSPVRFWKPDRILLGKNLCEELGIKAPF